MMKFLCLILFFLPFQVIAVESVIPDRLQAYQADGVKSFSAKDGETLWLKKHLAEDGSKRSCQTCHGLDLKKTGAHARSGKIIDPMALSVNPNRYTDVKEIEKWFKRNCKWTIGRECTSQEKGNILLFLKSL